jgi:beta-glucuronidase
VSLLVLPEAFVQDYVIALAPGRTDAIAIDVVVSGAAADPVDVEIAELGVRATVAIDGEGRGRAEIAATPELWSPDSPRLYDVALQFGDEVVRDRIGFRSLAVRDGRIILNGEPVFLRGVSTHEESVLHPGRSQGEDDARATLGLVRELGCNFVRLAHYPHDEATVRVADELGLLVWSEVPVYWSVNWASEAALRVARSQISEMVRRDRNRASVIIWSVANETPHTPERLAFIRTLIEDTRALDATRLISAALFGDLRAFFQAYTNRLMRFVADDASAPADQRERATDWLRRHGVPAAAAEHKVEDPIAAELDVVGHNQYLGWYTSAHLARALPFSETELRDIELNALPHASLSAPGKPLIVSEFGADAKAGFEGDERTVFSERFQERFYRAQLAMLSRSPGVQGLSPWVLKDFRTLLRTHPNIRSIGTARGWSIPPAGGSAPSRFCRSITGG